MKLYIYTVYIPVDSFYGQVIQRKEVGRFGLRPSLGEKRKVWTSAIHNSLGKSNPFGKKHNASPCGVFVQEKRHTQTHTYRLHIYIYTYNITIYSSCYYSQCYYDDYYCYCNVWFFWGFEMFWELRMASDARRDPQLWLCDLSRSGIPCKSSQSDKLAYIIWIYYVWI